MTAWRTVPVEPTPEMLAAFLDELNNPLNSARSFYRAFLAAAPEPPVSELEKAAAALAVRCRNRACRTPELERLQRTLEGLK
jgi:hypothetical protein